MTGVQKTAVNVVFGAMTFGRKGTEQGRVFTIDGCKAILDVFQAHGHNEVDTARVYAEGTSEEFLGELDWQKRGLVMDTKYYPAPQSMVPTAPEGGWRHTPEHLRENIQASLKALKADKIDMWYLHGPDRKTPLEVTLKVVNDFHKQGLFERFGISNYMSWEVAEICEICRRNNFVMPSVYQGVYNALHRAADPELITCLRHYGLAFYTFNPLAGGYLTGRYHRDTTQVEENSRFDPKNWQGKAYRARYWNDAFFDALDILRPVAKKHGLTEAECALRWMMHHSQLKREFGDAVLIGASSTEHMEENMKNLEKGPLPEDVVQALDEGWQRVKGVSSKYHH